MSGAAAPDTILARIPDPSYGHDHDRWGSLSDDEKRSENRQKELVIKRQEQEISQLSEVHALRKGYLLTTFVFVGAFVVSVLALVVLAGCGVLALGDAVLSTLMASMTATVVGILAIAFKWLFPRG